MRAGYHYNEHFAILDEIVQVDRFESCRTCGCNLPAIDIQPIDCLGCSTIDESERKEQIYEKMIWYLVVLMTINIHLDIV